MRLEITYHNFFGFPVLVKKTSYYEKPSYLCSLDGKRLVSEDQAYKVPD